jgi:O-antigen/teichoic acid export membrane protein
VTDTADTGQAEREAAALEAAAPGMAGAPGATSLLGAAMLGIGGTVLVGLLGVIRTKVLAVDLEPSGLGLYGQMLTLLTALGAASGLGLGLGTTRVVAESRARDDSEGLKRALEVSFALPLAFGVLLALLLGGASGALASLLLDDDRGLLIVFAALAVPLVALQGPLVHALQGFRDVAGAQGANILFGFVLTIASVAGVIVAGLDGAVLALAASNVVLALALAWRLRRLLRGTGIRLELRAGLRMERLKDRAITTMLAIGFASAFVGVASWAGELAVRTFLLKQQGADAAGIFQALQLISVQLIGVIVVSIAFLSFTAITEAHAVGNRAVVRRTVDDALRLALLLVIPVVLLLGLLRNEVIQILLSSGFDRAADLLPRQLIGDLLRTVAWILGAALVPLGLTRIWAGISVAVAVAYIATAAVLVPSHGLDGAVLAYIVQWAVAAGATVAVLVRRGLFRPGRMTVRTLVVAAAAGGVVLIPRSAWPAAAAASAVLIAVLAVFATSREERDAFFARARGFTRR